MLEIKDPILTLSGRQILSGSQSFAVEGGEAVCLSGHSGSGKTMLLRVLMGLQPLDSGFVSMDGDLLTPLSAPYFRRHMAYVPQELEPLYPTVEEWLDELLDLKVNRQSDVSLKMVVHELKLLGLEPSLLGASMGEVAYHDLQLIMLVVALLLKKPYVLVDHIGSVATPKVAELLARMKQNGQAVVLVSNEEALSSLCNYLIRMDASTPLQTNL
ncbi:ABC transporter ATP-binding protein [Prevotella sp.]|uniref:ABC transporter ATP-binding protein n=1 Tax=Prevotella sp. TaxID=59823 RepID=UPI002F957539